MKIEDGFVFIKGSDPYWLAYEEADKLEVQFPNQGAIDFILACEYNDELNFIENKEIIEFKMVYEGENDKSSWCWLVTFKYSYRDFVDKDSYIYIGGCDFSGWDCQSWLDKYSL